MEGFFAACGLPDILERSPRGERPAARLRHRPCLMEDRGKLLKVRHGIRLPCRSIPETEHHGPLLSDKMAFRPLRPEIATKRAGCRAAPVLLPGVVRVPAPPTLPSLPVSPKRPSSARIASRPAACHAASLIKAYDRRDPPLHRRNAPSRLSRAIPAPRKQARERKRERKHSAPLHSPASPLLSGRMACLISNSRQTATGTFAPT